MKKEELVEGEIYRINDSYPGSDDSDEDKEIAKAYRGKTVRYIKWENLYARCEFLNPVIYSGIETKSDLFQANELDKL